MFQVNRPTLIFTGGHHTSALALAESLKKRDWQIIWIGHRHSQWQDKADSAEYKEVTKAKILFLDLQAGKVYRTFHPVKLIRLPWGFIQSFCLILNLRLKLKSDLKGIVTFGGYLGMPVVFTGWLLGLPSIAHEQTVTAGWANKFIACFAKKVALSWPESSSNYPKDKQIFTGLPIRQEIILAKKNQNQIERIPHQIYITGGKQGSHIINETVFSTLSKLLPDFLLVHQTGSSTVYHDYEKAIKLRSSLPPHLKSNYQVFSYLDPSETARFLSTSGIVISRAGAHIIYELGLLGTKCVLIPIPWSSHQEQLKNATILSSHHQAIILAQSELNPTSLIKSISAAAKLHPIPLNLSITGLDRMVTLVEQTFS
jgi:UDP-N-acetylglucosamine--N-acetylmuramyl-(pentapeptide) pyrophosphoryl-undecaprenol N-acetylglucosamine transferase